jgi:hypothetical protein
MRYPTNARGLYDLYPRAAYVLREAHNVNPFEGASLEYVDNVFQIYP